MVKSQLIRRVTAKLKYLSHQDVELAVNRMLTAMGDSLCRLDRIEIRGFGSFAPRYRASRNAHNPKSGKRVRTEPKYTPHFKPGKEMRERINATYGQPIKGMDDENDDS